MIASVQASVRSFQLSLAMREIWEVIGATNRYIVAREPWTLAKGGTRSELDTALYVAADALYMISELIRPFMPATAERLLAMLGVTPAPASWTSLHPNSLRPGSRIGDTVPLFPRIEHSVEELRQMTSDPTTEASPTTPTPSTTSAPSDRISIDDFMKVELRVAKVLAAERVPKSKRLLKLTVDVGAEQRTLVAGIAESYEPESLVGRTIVVVFNLKPATLMGVESNGMVLAASPEGGAPRLLGFDEAPPPGTRVR
jgi:methionyl-tRNA synthetase